MPTMSALVAALTACAGPQSMLDPAGPSARAIAQVWWWMFGVATLVLLFVSVTWLVAMRRGSGHGRDENTAHRSGRDEDAARRIGRRWMIGGGIVLPGVAILALLLFGSPAGFHQLPLPLADAAPPPLRVQAIGRQWQWELHYPEHDLRLVNELRVPVGRPVDVETGSTDVIHSFWVPRLGGKLDAIPGRSLVVRLQADVPGVFRGQCAEFCGLGHAHMTMVVHAMPPDAFDDWVAEQRAAAAGTAAAASSAASSGASSSAATAGSSGVSATANPR